MVIYDVVKIFGKGFAAGFVVGAGTVLIFLIYKFKNK